MNPEKNKSETEWALDSPGIDLFASRLNTKRHTGRHSPGGLTYQICSLPNLLFYLENQIRCTYRQSLKGFIHSARQYDFYYAKCRAITQGSRTFRLSYKYYTPILERGHQQTVHYVPTKVGTVLLPEGD